MPTLLVRAEGETPGGEARGGRGPCAVEDPMHAWNLSAREPGEPCPPAGTEPAGRICQTTSGTDPLTTLKLTPSSVQ